MSRFNFRLQSILDYRRSLADQAKLELAAARTRLAQEESALGELRLAESAALAELAEAQRTVQGMARLLQLLDHLSVLGERINAQVTVVQRLQIEVERRQEIYLDLTKGVKALEKLRERQAEEFVRESQRAERDETAETAARQYWQVRAGR